MTRGLLLGVFVLGVLFPNVGCGDGPDAAAPRPGTTPTATSVAAAAASTAPAAGAPSRSGPSLPLFDGFEGGRLADFWLPGDYGAGRYVPGAIVVTGERARSGRAAVRITVKEGDVRQEGDDGIDTERAELDSGRHPLVGRDVSHGFSFLVPAGFPVVDNRLVISQWKQNGVKGGPLIAQRFRDGRHYLTVRLPQARAGDEDQQRYRLPEMRFDTWNDMVYHARFSAGGDGRVEVWMNGKRVAAHAGPNCFKDGEDLVYNKFGLYRDRWKDPMTIYFDNYTVGESFEAVDPRRFDR